MNQQPLAAAASTTVASLSVALKFTAVSVLTLGLLYPALITVIAHGMAPDAANGSLIYSTAVPQRIIGTQNAGQLFTGARYFHGRPSAAGAGYDPRQTGGSNLGPTSKKLLDRIASAADALRKENPAAAALPLPAELVTASASGIDPDITPEGADFQGQRIANSRNLDISEVRSLIMRYTKPRLLGIFGEPHVNVLNLNRALDAQERHR